MMDDIMVGMSDHILRQKSGDKDSVAELSSIATHGGKTNSRASRIVQ